MKKFIYLLKIEFRRIFSNGVLVAVFFGAPILYGLMFGNVYKKGKITDMPIAVIDEDNTPMSGKIIDALNDNENLAVKKVQYDAGNLAAEMPSKNYIAVVTIPSGFEADIYQKRYPELLVDINMSNLVPANFASRGIQAVLGTVSAGVEIEALKKAGTDPVSAAQRYEPFKVNYNRLYNPASNYMELMMPGILGTILQQVLFLGLALVFARDVEDGYFKKLAIANKWSLYHIVLKALPFIILIIPMWLIVAGFYPVFNIEIQVFTWPMALLVTIFTFACMFIGMLFSLLVPNQLRATELLMVLATPSFLLSGYTWPMESMPRLIQQFANMLPLTHFLEGFRRIAVYKGTFKDIQPQMSALAWITAICFVMMVALLQIKINKERKVGILAS
ncbi:ABC transporter permease [Chitinophagaceae bacterium LB-8]|uniref:ABC transporter permease n=1 Tax=Paraflavisolibacter caeni TaxID=2982496 RepID=A0A9X3BH70_9BACT|nr:ABC transporter permease [Paraflavisolibacter caeni]MCU7551994.1 ABC transporter permease [Paraflavisolibacter caeni]